MKNLLKKVNLAGTRLWGYGRAISMECFKVVCEGLQFMACTRICSRRSGDKVFYIYRP
jgi:hypothetical protein